MSGVGAAAATPYQLSLNGHNHGYGGALDRSMFTDSSAAVAANHGAGGGGPIDWEKAAAAAQLQASLHAQQAQLAYLKQQQLQQESWMRSVGMLGPSSDNNNNNNNNNDYLHHPPSADAALQRDTDFAASSRMQQAAAPPYMEQLAQFALHGGVEGKTAQLLDDLARSQQQQQAQPSGTDSWTPDFQDATGMSRKRSSTTENYDGYGDPYKRTRM